VARPVPSYVCQECGASTFKWSGRCEACGAWNTIVEEAPRPRTPLGRGRSPKAARAPKIDFVRLCGETVASERLRTGIAEFDRVCGGGDRCA
jgi:DNA repair protein RadA/Sms